MVREVRVSWEGLGGHPHPSFHSDLVSDLPSDEWELDMPEETASAGPVEEKPEKHSNPSKDTKRHLADADWINSPKRPAGKRSSRRQRKSA